MSLQFITFTGPDGFTSPEDIISLCSAAPPGAIEIAVLVSTSRAGSPRYPTPEQAAAILKLADKCGQRTAAHVCGTLALDMLNQGHANTGRGAWSLVFQQAERIQINVRKDVLDETISIVLQGIPSRLDKTVILQARGTFPRSEYLEREPRLMWLFDESGGRGTAPTRWPEHPDRKLAGYAGGITPENIGEVVRQLGERGPYWLDMETGCRTDDRFDWRRCAAAYRNAVEAART